MSSYFQLRMSYIPNAICILRIILVIPIIDFLWDKQYENALGLIAIAGISDFLDGFLAKRNNWRSKLGAALDPAADKILLVSVFVTLYFMDLIPFWLMATVLMRDFMILFGLALYYYFIENPIPICHLSVSSIQIYRSSLYFSSLRGRFSAQILIF